jgi:hypothetical protein
LLRTSPIAVDMLLFCAGKSVVICDVFSIHLQGQKDFTDSGHIVVEFIN